MKQYRTQEQLEEIADNCNNGNWSDGAKGCVEYGFYVNDFSNMEASEYFSDGWEDIAIVCEMAMKLRNEN